MCKLLHVNYSGGGIGVYGVAVDAALKATVADVDVAFSSDVFCYKNKSFLDRLGFLVYFFRLVYGSKPDLVLDSSGKCSIYFYFSIFLVCFLLRVKYMPVEHDPVAHSDMKYGFIKDFLCKLVLDRSAKVIVHGERCKKDFVSKNGFAPVVIPHVELSHFKDHKSEENVFEFSNNCFNVLFFGALRPNKGVDLLPGVARELDILNGSGNGMDRKEYKLYVVGSKRLSPELMKSCWPLALENILTELRGCSCVKIYDSFISDEYIASLFEKTNLVLLPYKDATQSGVLALAASFGKPVVATDVGDLGLDVEKYKLGVLSQYSSKSLVGALRVVEDNEGKFLNSMMEYKENVICYKKVGHDIFKVVREICK